MKGNKLLLVGKTGFRFALEEADVLTPVRDAVVNFLPTGEEFEADVKGVIRAYLPELKKGETYKYMLTAPGYEEVAGDLVAHTRVMHKVPLVLKRAVMSAVVSPLEDVKKIG